MKIEPRTLKGFRDFLPDQMKKRQFVIDKLRAVFESYGFEGLETPALEYEEILTGKYGEEGDKLMYKFEDLGGRKVAMRYDQTVPLARVVAQYRNELIFPFKRYQIQPVWRAENTQRGRFREFYQCDADIVGTDSIASDVEIITIASDSLKRLGFEKCTIRINDRSLLNQFSKDTITAIDKIKKIGRDGVIDELISKNAVKDKTEGETLLETISNLSPTERIRQITETLVNNSVKFDPTLARGLDYYTGVIIEAEVEGYKGGSVGGGGRYDNLIGMFSGQKIPAVGFAFGFDRLIEAMEELQLFQWTDKAKLLVTVFSKETEAKSLELANNLRRDGINTELYLNPDAKIDKQIRYADKKGIPFVAIIGPEESAAGTATIKNLETGEQVTLPYDQVPSAIQTKNS